MKHYKLKIWWTIWAIGFHKIQDSSNRVVELKIFIGPVVLTMWK